MLRSVTYSVWRGMGGLRGAAKGRPPAPLGRHLHTSAANTTQAIPEQDAGVTQVTENNERLSENDIVSPNFINRNPRNLERMAVARKDKGWGQSHPRRDYWHKLHFEKSNRHTRAYIQHYDGSVILSASTEEWAIKKYLYSTADVAAAENIGRVLAQRCLESGIAYMHLNMDKEARSYERVKAFLEAMREGGVVLSEPKSITDFEQPVNYFPEDY